jgi:hypothetical protein
MRSLLVLVASAACVFGSGVSSAVQIYSDDFSTNTLSTYNINGGSLVTYSAIAGVGGGGGLVIGQASNDSTTLIPSGSSYVVAPGPSGAVTISMMLKLNANGFGGGTSKAFIGLSDSGVNAWGQNPPAGTSTVGGALQNAVQIGFRAGGNGGAAANGGMQPAVSLTGGNWYLFSTTLEKPVSGVIWSASGFLQDFGSTGTTPGAVVTSYGPSNINVAGDLTLSAALTPAFLNFGVRNQSWSAIDNFSATVVPEPSSVALLVLAGAIGVRRRSR